RVLAFPNRCRDIFGGLQIVRFAVPGTRCGYCGIDAVKLGRIDRHRAVGVASGRDFAAFDVTRNRRFGLADGAPRLAERVYHWRCESFDRTIARPVACCRAMVSPRTQKPTGSSGRIVSRRSGGLPTRHIKIASERGAALPAGAQKSKKSDFWPAQRW